MRVKNKTLTILSVSILLLFWIYHSNHYYTDPLHGCDIKLHGFLYEFNNANVLKALKVLSYASENGYRDVCENVNDIHLNASCGGFQGGCYYYSAKNEIYVSTAQDQFLGWTSAVIVHEACHSKQKNEGRSMSEDECYQRSHDILVELVQHEQTL